MTSNVRNQGMAPTLTGNDDRSQPGTVGTLAYALVELFTSLKLAVALQAMAIFIVLAGTMAQVDKGIWQVVDEYFRVPIAWIDLKIFFPPHWFPGLPAIPGRFPFPEHGPRSCDQHSKIGGLGNIEYLVFHQQ